MHVIRAEILLTSLDMTEDGNTCNESDMSKRSLTFFIHVHSHDSMNRDHNHFVFVPPKSQLLMSLVLMHLDGECGSPEAFVISPLYSRFRCEEPQ